jgi:ArsR family transcriptional regulator
MAHMDLVTIYECLCDKTRLRILNLLCQGPLCVCHIQEILGEPQVKVSKHLGYLKAHGLVEVSRSGSWRIYRLIAKRTKVLESNLACLQDCAAEDRIFRRDADKLTVLAPQSRRGRPRVLRQTSTDETSNP